MEELQAVMNKEIGIERLEKVRDVFVFSCWTGLAYIDVYTLKDENIQKYLDGNYWIISKRHKTGIPINVRLLDIPLKILKKYKGKQPDHRALPMPGNQKMNSYLKGLADICGIRKNLTYHLARHTSATTVTLTNGVSMESVSKMLGHTNIRTTQIYAKVINQKSGSEMDALAGKLNISMNTL
ncbi:MAG: site-specific integrase [Parabacteroides sp.]|nr:site-specific integrase [Parabacteroides sp.]